MTVSERGVSEEEVRRMGLGGFLDYSGDNEPQDDAPTGLPNKPDPNDKSGLIGGIGCLVIVVIIVLAIWYFRSFP